MQDQMLNVDELRKFIGHEVEHGGQRCQIIEILEDGPALILQDESFSSTIQPDQHGEAHRRVPATVTVRVFEADGEVNPEFEALNLKL